MHTATCEYTPVKQPRTYEFNGRHNARIKITQGYIHTVAVPQNRRLLSFFFMNNITNKRGKMQYAELPEFSCWLALIGSQHKCRLNLIIHIVFPDDDTLSVRSRDNNCKREKNRLQEFPLPLYQPHYILLCFLLREVKNKKKLNGQRNDLLQNKVFSFLSIFFSCLTLSTFY